MFFGIPKQFENLLFNAIDILLLLQSSGDEPMACLPDIIGTRKYFCLLNLTFNGKKNT